MWCEEMGLECFVSHFETGMIKRAVGGRWRVFPVLALFWRHLGGMDGVGGVPLDISFLFLLSAWPYQHRFPRFIIVTNMTAWEHKLGTTTCNAVGIELYTALIPR